MQTLEALRSKIESARELGSVVTTMKSLAAVNIHQYEEAVSALVEYNRTIEMGLHILLRSRAEEIALRVPASPQRLGAIVFGSDQGMVGQFNPVVVEYALDEMNGMQVERDERTVAAVGRRVAARLEQAGQAVDHLFAVPNAIAGITSSVQEVLVHVESWRTQKRIERIVLFYNSPEGGAAYRPVTWHLMPLDLEWLERLKTQAWPSRVLPTFRMNWRRLFSALLRNHFFVALYRAFAESLASENASRLSSMQVAEKNIEERLDELEAQYHHLRQSSITAELLDVVAGFEALADSRS